MTSRRELPPVPSAADVEVRPVPATRRALGRAVRFAIDLYRGNPYYVPPLIRDEVNTLLPGRNPAFDFCEAQTFMAWRGAKPVGRITAIINRAVNARTGRREMRFAFFDFVDDPRVSRALFDAAAQWGRQRGMDTVVGPMGFTDMDHEGALVDGYAEQGTMATIYNYPYYIRHFQDLLGLRKDAEWVEYRVTVPPAVPEKYARIAAIVAKKYQLRTVRFRSRRKLKKAYGQALFGLINEAYDQLYGYSPLTPRQIEYYIRMYLGLLRLQDISLVVDAQDALVGVGISLTSFSRALQRSRGRLWPLGWRHFIRPLRGKDTTVDLLLVAVKPEYQTKGANALIFNDLLPHFIANGYQYAESNPELATNGMVQRQWDYFEHRQHRRRQAFRGDL